MMTSPDSWKNGRKTDSLTFPFHIPYLKLAGALQPGVIILLGGSEIILKTFTWVTNRAAWRQSLTEMRQEGVSLGLTGPGTQWVADECVG